MKTNAILILALALSTLALSSCKKSDIVKAEEQRHEAAVAAIKADYNKAVTAEEGNHKIALTLSQVAELKAQADAEVKKAGLPVTTVTEDAKIESKELEKKSAAVATPAPAPQAIIQTTPSSGIALNPPAPSVIE